MYLSYKVLRNKAGLYLEAPFFIAFTVQEGAMHTLLEGEKQLSVLHSWKRSDLQEWLSWQDMLTGIIVALMLRV